MWLPLHVEGEVFRGDAVTESPSEDEQVMERVVEKDNLIRALKQVMRNGGSPGIDGMTVEGLGPYLKDCWPRLKMALLEGSYAPQPVKRVEIPKPGGGVRKLGIPTVVDRFIPTTILSIPSFRRKPESSYSCEESDQLDSLPMLGFLDAPG